MDGHLPEGVGRVAPDVSTHGGVVVSRYALKAGQGVPMHTHIGRPGTEHITIVACGAIRIKGPGLDVIVPSGGVYDYAPTEQTHELVALEDAVVFNVMKATLP